MKSNGSSLMFGRVHALNLSISQRCWIPLSVLGFPPYLIFIFPSDSSSHLILPSKVSDPLLQPSHHRAISNILIYRACG